MTTVKFNATGRAKFMSGWGDLIAYTMEDNVSISALVAIAP